MVLVNKLSYLLSISFGASLGAILRYEIFLMLANKPNYYATLLVNGLGSFIIGVLFVIFNNLSSPQLQLVLITGLLGSFTTFSTFSLDVIKLIYSGNILEASWYMLIQVILGVSFCYFGVKIANQFY